MKHPLILLKQVLGYLLFITAIIYALSKTPQEIWDVDPVWIIPATLFTAASLFIQILQLKVFLDFHNQKIDWEWITLFTIRKGILNTFLPAKSGTFVLLHTLTKKYEVSWKDYVHYMIFSSPVTLFISLIFLVSLFIDPLIFIVILILLILLSYVLRKYFSFSYIKCLPVIIWYAFFLYFIFLAILWCLLLGLGYNISLYEASCFAIAINALSQISITPGNLGVREVILGILAPYLALPVSVGILAGAILFALRVGVSAVILVIMEGRILPKNDNVNAG